VTFEIKQGQVAMISAKWPGLPRGRRWGQLATRFQGDGSGRLVHFLQTFDRNADRYHEHVEDAATGEVIRHVEEPLSQHHGHGSAKRR
jgi:hypothetical protein